MQLTNLDKKYLKEILQLYVTLRNNVLPANSIRYPRLDWAEEMLETLEALDN